MTTIKQSRDLATASVAKGNWRVSSTKSSKSKPARPLMKLATPLLSIAAAAVLSSCGGGGGGTPTGTLSSFQLLHQTNIQQVWQ